MRPEDLEHRLTTIPWLSEGFSYLVGEMISPYATLRGALVEQSVVPWWDEEIVKLLLAGLLHLTPERAGVPVVEFDEFQRLTPQSAVVNFRNRRSYGSAVASLLSYSAENEHSLGYVRRFVERVIVETS